MIAASFFRWRTRQPRTARPADPYRPSPVGKFLTSTRPPALNGSALLAATAHLTPAKSCRSETTGARAWAGRCSISRPTGTGAQGAPRDFHRKPRTTRHRAGTRKGLARTLRRRSDAGRPVQDLPVRRKTQVMSEAYLAAWQESINRPGVLAARRQAVDWFTAPRAPMRRRDRPAAKAGFRAARSAPATTALTGAWPPGAYCRGADL